MTQHVFDNAMVAHVWAQGTQTHGRSNNGQFYFEAGTIYSYGAHFPIAMRDNNGTVLMTMEGSSVTTERHKSLVRRALDSTVDVVMVPQFGNYAHVAKCTRKGKFENSHGCFDHKENWNEFKREFNDALLKASRARTNAEYHLSNAIGILKNMREYKAYFGLRWVVPAMPDTEALVDIKKRNAEAQRKAAERLRKKQAQNLKRWLGGESVSSYQFADTWLRIQGDNIQTSQNAIFPVSHAIPAFKFISRCRNLGEQWETNGKTIHLGHFKIDKIERNGNVKAGCHYVKWHAIERVAKQLGLV